MNRTAFKKSNSFVHFRKDLGKNEIDVGSQFSIRVTQLNENSDSKDNNAFLSLYYWLSQVEYSLSQRKFSTYLPPSFMLIRTGQNIAA